MKKLLKKAIMPTLVAAVAVLAVSSSTNAQQSTDVYLTITGGSVTISGATTFNFGTFTVSDTVVTQDKQFTGAAEVFSVRDTKGVDAGYYTTLSVTNLSGSAANFIPASNVYIKADTVTKLDGTDNANVVVNIPTYTALDTPVTFLKRDTAVNNGVIGEYGTWPWLRVEIPAYQTVDTYQGTLTYTLYEN